MKNLKYPLIVLFNLITLVSFSKNKLNESKIISYNVQQNGDILVTEDLYLKFNHDFVKGINYRIYSIQEIDTSYHGKSKLKMRWYKSYEFISVKYKNKNIEFFTDNKSYLKIKKINTQSQELVHLQINYRLYDLLTFEQNKTSIRLKIPTFEKDLDSLSSAYLKDSVFIKFTIPNKSKFLKSIYQFWSLAPGLEYDSVISINGKFTINNKVCSKVIHYENHPYILVEFTQGDIDNSIFVRFQNDPYSLLKFDYWYLIGSLLLFTLLKCVFSFYNWKKNNKKSYTDFNNLTVGDVAYLKHLENEEKTILPYIIINLLSKKALTIKVNTPPTWSNNFTFSLNKTEPLVNELTEDELFTHQELFKENNHVLIEKNAIGDLFLLLEMKLKSIISKRIVKADYIKSNYGLEVASYIGLFLIVSLSYIVNLANIELFLFIFTIPFSIISYFLILLYKSTFFSNQKWYLLILVPITGIAPILTFRVFYEGVLGDCFYYEKIVFIGMIILFLSFAHKALGRTNLGVKAFNYFKKLKVELLNQKIPNSSNENQDLYERNLGWVFVLNSEKKWNQKFEKSFISFKTEDNKLSIFNEKIYKSYFEKCKTCLESEKESKI